LVHECHGTHDVGRKIILKWVLEKYYRGGIDWIHLAEDRDQWRALLNMVMNFWVP
jgi:hypothetical protein